MDPKRGCVSAPVVRSNDLPSTQLVAVHIGGFFFRTFVDGRSLEQNLPQIDRDLNQLGSADVPESLDGFRLQQRDPNLEQTCPGFPMSLLFHT